MIRSVTGLHPARWMLAAALLGLGSTACDAGGLLVAPAPAPDGRTLLALSMTPAAIGTAQQPSVVGAADRLRVQVRRAGTLVADTILPFVTRSGAVEASLPLDPPTTPTAHDLEVELRVGRQAVLRGARTIRLQRRQLVTAEIELSPASLRTLSPVRQISGGVFHSCAVKTDDQGYCWGDNASGQLGDGTTGARLTPVRVGAGRAFREVHAGYVSSCGLGTDQRAYCWGENEHGVLGTGGGTSSRVPVPVATDLVFASLTMGGLHACALTADGRALCWGFNEFGQLGDGTVSDRAVPVASAPELRFRALSAGYLHTCGLTFDGRAFCWGYNEYGQLGNGSTADRSSAAQVDGVPPLESISGGGLHTCGVTADGRAFCWGYNRYGQLGDGTAAELRSVAAAVAGPARFRSVAAGGGHTCGISDQSRVHCWGYNHSGALGIGSRTHMREPAGIEGLTAHSLGVGLHHTCAVTPSDDSMCWGFNRFGQLGDRSTVNGDRPGAVDEEATPSVGLGVRAPAYPDDLRVLLGPGR